MLSVWIISGDRLVDFPYYAGTILDADCLINLDTQIMIVPRMLKDDSKGPLFDNVIDVVSLETGKVFDSFYTNLHMTQEIPGAEGFIKYKPSDNKNTTHVKFHIIRLIKKRSFYLGLMRKTYIEQHYGEELCRKVLSMLT